MQLALTPLHLFPNRSANRHGRGLTLLSKEQATTALQLHFSAISRVWKYAIAKLSLFKETVMELNLDAWYFNLTSVGNSGDPVTDMRGWEVTK